MNRFQIGLLALALSAPVAAACAQEQAPSPIEPSVQLERAFPNLEFDKPLFLTPAGDGTPRLFVIEKKGVIRVFQDDQETKDTQVFLDISERVSLKGNEEGLLGIAFHPKYKENGYFYLHYSSSKNDRMGTLAEFRVHPEDPNKADPSYERILIEVEQPWRNHNGGMIAFGPDGYLYWALGDGGAADDPHGNGQNLKTLLGSILRIDVSSRTGELPYGIPADNPFVSEPEGARGEIWAFGLRNAWRFSFDRETGELWAGDVGQNRWEEIDLVTKGGNYGWNVREGFDPFYKKAEISHGMAIEPIAVYGRREGVSITGGYVYRGSRFPELRGSYFYGDYTTGNIWRITKNEHGTYHNAIAQEKSGCVIGSFAEDAKGEIYVLNYGGKGEIMRLIPRKD
ncbi:MAG: PQQ-dependent sugar dehydrogenase [Planctomycetes bacterium]|nr:PQQ-dependent sugar dehydrogenase [Planctomycetota bacterium]